MSKENRSISEEDLKNTSGGFILKDKLSDGRPVFVLFDDKGKPVAPVNSENAAKALAKERGIKNQNVISAEDIKYSLSHFSTDELKGMLRYLGIEKD